MLQEQVRWRQLALPCCFLNALRTSANRRNPPRRHRKRSPAVERIGLGSSTSESLRHLLIRLYSRTPFVCVPLFAYRGTFLPIRVLNDQRVASGAVKLEAR